MAKELRLKKKSELDIIAAFMTAERQHQKQQEEPIRTSRETSKNQGAKDRCHGCNQMGHKIAQCPRKTSHSTTKTHSTSQNPPNPCPACAGTHTAIGNNGKTYYKTRLSACDVFISKPVEERATIIQAAGGCVLCLDSTGDHQVSACQAKGRDGRMFESCNRLVSGTPCGKWHNYLLHGTGNSYCNSVRRVLTSNIGVPNVLGEDSPGTPTIDEIEAADSVVALLQLQYVPVDSRRVK